MGFSLIHLTAGYVPKVSHICSAHACGTGKSTHKSPSPNCSRKLQASASALNVLQRAQVWHILRKSSIFHPLGSPSPNIILICKPESAGCFRLWGGRCHTWPVGKAARTIPGILPPGFACFMPWVGIKTPCLATFGGHQFYGTQPLRILLESLYLNLRLKLHVLIFKNFNRWLTPSARWEAKATGRLDSQGFTCPRTIISANH